MQFDPDRFVEEPPLVPEERYTKHARPGWRAWNPYSPEHEFCEFVASFIGLQKPESVIETGVGQGYLAVRILSAMQQQFERGIACRYEGFETNLEIRQWLQRQAEFSGDHAVISEDVTPNNAQFAAADLTVLDSERDLRIIEIENWAQHGKPGSYCIIHDTGNGHAETSRHHTYRQAIRDSGLRGVDLPNPRGSFLAKHQ